MTTDNDSPKTFLDAQLEFAKSKHGKALKRQSSKANRYYQIKLAAAKRAAQAQATDDKEGQQ